MKTRTYAARWPQPCRWIAISSLLLCTIFLHALPLAAQKGSDRNAYIQKTYQRLGGIYYAYPVPENNLFAAAPQGYKLVYLSHYGRHGSRWMTSDKRYEWLWQQFEDERQLTRQGRSVRRRLKKICDNARGNGGQLSPVGVRQQHGLLLRMSSRFPQLFAPESRVTARSSVVRRCRKSMEAFVEEMKALGLGARIDMRTDSVDMQWMSHESPDEMLLKLQTDKSWTLPTHRLLASLFLHPEAIADTARLFSELYAVASDLQDVDLPGISLYDLFTLDEMRYCYQRACREMRYENGVDPGNHGIPAQCAANLWGNIVLCADRVLASGKPGVTLRFGHDTALYRLLSLLGASPVVDDSLNLAELVPMAANLQMLFYRNRQDSVVVAFYLNERPITLHGIHPALAQDSCHVSFYSWAALKHHLHHFLDRQQWMDRTRAINTMVGTDYATTASAGRYGKGSEEHGQTLPAVLVPHGMNFWTPQTQDTEQKCRAPYYYRDSLFQGFRASHWLVGGCTQDYGSFTLMPMTGRLRLKPEARATAFSHDDELSHPYYYGVYLPKEKLMTEMTATSRCAIFRFMPDEDGEMHVVVQANNDYREGFVAVDTARQCIWGYNPVHRIYQGWGERAGFSGWFVVQFQRPFRRCGVKDSVAFVTLDVKGGEQVLVKAATSFTGIDGAWRNLHAELPGWDFLGTRLALDSIWQDELRTIDVEDSDKAKVNEFYGALYRTAFEPHAISDVDGRYPAFASGQPMMPDSTDRGRSRYMDFSMWDIYRAESPLLLLTHPKMASDMIQSLGGMYREGGWMPIFPCWNSYTSAMIGDHAASLVADAVAKGLDCTHPFDLKTVYEGLRRNAFESPKSDKDYANGMGRRALKSWLRYGFIPLEDSVKEAFHTQEQVSRTLEYAYDDYCVAQVAKALNQKKDYETLMRRSRNWMNVLNPRTGWADGRHANGRWLMNRDLTSRLPFITEGAVMHYSFYVPHDIPGLIGAMGGRQAFIQKLDTLFGFHRDGRRDSVCYYWHGNEPCHHIAYLYALAGEPWKTQRVVSDILRTEYRDVPGGLSGNDDAGQMSAWQVFSMLGFYPVCPGIAEYVFGTPSFHRARIGRLTIETRGGGNGNCYVLRMTWNGKPYTRYTLSHDMLIDGGHLVIELGPEPLR